MIRESLGVLRLKKDLCNSCFRRNVAEVSNFIEGLKKQRSEMNVETFSPPIEILPRAPHLPIIARCLSAWAAATGGQCR